MSGPPTIDEMAQPDLRDPASLAAWFSGFAWSEHMRKVRLANCRELVRADFAAKNVKISEARLDDLARNHWSYLKYLADHLIARIAWEREKLRMGFGA